MNRLQPVFFLICVAAFVLVFLSLMGLGPVGADVAVAIFVFSLFGWIVTLTSGGRTRGLW
jgi:hypothetical protein